MTDDDRLLALRLAKAAEKALQALKALQRTPYREHGTAGAKWRAAADRAAQTERELEHQLRATREACQAAYLQLHPERAARIPGTHIPIEERARQEGGQP